MNLTYKKYIIPIFTGFILFLSYMLQKKLLLSGDVGYLLHATKQLLLGGKYGEDFFETNPPMILYLYTPAVLLAKYSSFSIIFSFHLYMYFLCFLSCVLSFYLLIKILPDDDFVLRIFLFFVILFIIFLLPMSSFGQREHLVMILTLPYVLGASLRIMGYPIPLRIAFLIGLIGGLGFAIKPYFLPTLCLIELYFVYKKRHLLAWMRVESLMVLSVLVLYFVSILLFQPEYIKIILPLLTKYYFPFIKKPWVELFQFGTVLFILAMIIAYPFFLKYDRYPALGNLLFLSLVGTFIAVLLSGAPWFYHVIPAFSFASLLLVYYTSHIFQPIFKKPISITDIFFLILANAVIFIYPIRIWYKLLMMLLSVYAYDSIVEMKEYFLSKPGNYSVTCFALTTLDCFPLVYHINGRYDGRFPLFWWLHGLNNLEKLTDGRKRSQIEKNKNHLINAIASDLNRYQTRWIILDKKIFKADQESFIQYFSKNENFKEAFSHYTYRTMINDREIYERSNPS